MTNTELVRLDDKELNQKLPVISILRDYIDLPSGDKQPYNSYNEDNYLIRRDYWENNIVCNRYMDKLRNSGVLESILKDELLFQKFLIKLHILLTKGLRRNKKYSGVSDITEEANFEDDWTKRFRNSSYVYMSAPSDALSEKILSSIFFDDENYCNDIGGNYSILNNDNNRIKLYISSYFPENLIDQNFNFKNEDIKNDIVEQINYFFNRKGNSHEISSTVVYILKFKDVEEGELYKTYIMHPSPKFIKTYLEKSRMSLLKLLSSTNIKEQLESLADAYQLAIRAQAFETVCNSLFMSIVNNFLKNNINLKQVPHGRLDFFADCFSKEKFREVFIEHVTKFQ